MKENTKLLLLLIFILVLLIIMIIPIQQNREFKQDAVIYKKELNKLNSRLDKIDIKIEDTSSGMLYIRNKIEYQDARIITKISKTIDDKFEQGFNCYEK